MKTHPAPVQYRAHSRSQTSVTVVLALLLGGWLLPEAALAQVAPRHREQLADIDLRAPTLHAAAATSTANANAVAALRRQVPGARVDHDGFHGAPAFVGSTSRFLTAPAGIAAPAARGGVPAGQPRDPHATVKSFVDEQAALFGHRSDSLSAARIRRDYVTVRNGLRTVVWEQQLDDIRVLGATFQAHLTARGELVNVASRFLASPDQAAQRGTPGRAAKILSPAISSRDAVAIAARNLSGAQFSGAQVAPEDVPQGAEKRQSFRMDGFTDLRAQLVWLPMDSATLRLAWEVICTSKARGEMFRVVVDAEAGVVQVRQNLTNYISNASYRVFTSDSPSPFSPGHPTPLTTQPPQISRTLVTTPALNTTASPNGWINDGIVETRGNNVDAHTDINADNLPDLPRPQASGAGRVFDPALDLTQAPSTYRDAAVVNLFYWSNWMHDRLYELGFTEAAGNFQNDNFGRGGFGNDAIEADAQDGSGFSNANFSTPPDGSPGRMQMYIFDAPFPARDGDFDAEIILHEYTHGLSNRLVGGGVGISALQSRGMGEGWSDFYSFALLSQAGDNPSGNYAPGGYSTYQLGGQTTNYYFGIRRYPYSTDLTKNPLTFRDIDPTQASAHPTIPRSLIIANTANAVHNMGEVWCATLWEARANLIAKHGFTIGNELILQLVTDGMKLAPANPNFLQARDAILQADLVNNGGANHSELWSAFAKRGMGSTATSPGSFTTVGVVESYSFPDDLSVTPTDPLAMNGTIGGPFKPTPTPVLTLTNTGASSLAWTATDNASWLDVSVANGTLVPAATATITVGPNASANSLAAGTYNATITVTNTTSGHAQVRTFSLLVEPFTVPIFTETFESGTLDSARWVTSGTGPWRTQITTGNLPHGGSRHLTMDSTLDGSYARNEATLTLNLAGERGIVLRFWAKIFNDEPDAPPAGPFTGGANFDGVAISADGTTWHEVQPLRLPSISNDWALFSVDLDAAIAARSLAYGSAFKIRFNQYDNFTIPTDGLALDDISVVRVINNRLSFTAPVAINENATPLSVLISATPAPTTDLVVTLTSSRPTVLGLSPTVTIPAGQSSASFTMTPVDDVLLNGTRDVSLSASATGWASATGSLDVHDNESATLSVTLPATTSEGTTDVHGTVTASSAPATDVKVYLTSNDITEVQPPPTVILAAGQTSVAFSLFVNDDNRIDGSHVSTVTATVTNWVAGSAAITVLDNESTTLALVTPANVRELDTGVSGTVRIAGTLPSNLVVSLSSDDPSEITVPTSVTIPAGQTTGNFVITVVDDTLADGAQTATITASAGGFVVATAAIAVADNDAHHFAVSPIAPAQIRNAPFSLTITAQDINGATITNYNSAVTLSAAAVGSGVAITPTSINGSGFTNGAWTGNVTIGGFATGVVVTASDGGGHTGSSNAFDVGTGSLHHFAWSTVTSPRYIDTPFAVTLTAQDAGNNTVAFDGTVDVGVRLPDRLEMLSWTGYADMTSGGEYENSKRAISSYFTNYNTTTTSVTDAGTLATQLAGKHVFFVPEQEFGTMSALGTQWAGTLTNFVSAGGTVIVCSWVGDEHGVLVNSGLLNATKVNTPSAVSVTKTATTPLNAGVATPFNAEYIATYTGTNGVVSLQSATDNNAIVVSRDVGAGRVVMIGTDYFTLGTGMDRVIANAVSTAAGTAATVPLRPQSVTLTGGVWSGSVSVPTLGTGMKLVASPASGPNGLSQAFDVTLPPPPSGSAVVFAEDFESGVLSGAWALSGTLTYRTQITTQHAPHGGTRHLTMDTSGDVARNEATLTLNLAGRSSVVLRFWAKMFDDDPTGPPPAPFPSSGADFDGVAISADGANWYEVQPLRSPVIGNNWSEFTVNLDAAIAARGLSYTSNFRIRFNHFDDSNIPIDGIALDDIAITAAPVGTPINLALPTQATEGATGISGSITLPVATTGALNVTLSSSAPAKATVPATVTIPAGQTTVAFTLTLPDDTLIDGNRTVVISASATGYQVANTSMTVVDNETPSLSLSTPSSIQEGGAPVLGTVSVGGAIATPLTVTLASSDPTATVPPSVTIPLGATSAQFTLMATNDNRIEGPQIVTITATLGSGTPVANTVTVQDDEDTSLTLIVPSTLREGDAAKTGTVRISGVVSSNVVVTLNSSDTTELTVPGVITLPAGQTSATFTLNIVDDVDADGPQSIVLSASATGFTTGTASRQVRDNDAHHFTFATIGSPLVSTGPVPAVITARDASNAPMTDYNSTIILTATSSGGALTVTPSSTNAFFNGVWNGSAQLNTVATNVVLTASDGQGHSGSSNAFNLVAAGLDRFVWDVVPSPQVVDAPFTATVRAVDSTGSTVSAYNGLANLSVLFPTDDAPIGDATNYLRFPLNTFEADTRSGIIYPAAQLRGPGRITALAFDVASPSGDALTNLTIRLKHTTASDFSGYSIWDNSGWTTVYRGSPTPSTTGWMSFAFTTPFDYDGTSNLMIDVTVDRAAAFYSPTFVNGSVSTATPAMAIATSTGTHGDPQTWTNNPGPSPFNARPNIRFTTLKELPIRPAQTSSFTSGVWNGPVSVPVARPGLQLRARAGATLVGTSNSFDVATSATSPTGSALIFSENFESGVFSSAWALTGTGNYRIMNTSLNGPHLGSRHMTLDAGYYTTAGARNEATLGVNLSGRNGVTLTFWARGYNEIPLGPPPSPFPSSGADFDGVAVSADGGTNWFEVLPLRTLTNGYAQYSVNLDAALAARGLTYTSNFKIRFNQHGIDYIPYSGIAIDDVSITANPLNGLAMTVPVQATEGVGAVTGTASLDVPRASDTVVTLASSAPAKAAVPSSVTIPTGQLSATFNINVPDDGIVDGDRVVGITGSLAAGSTVVSSMLVVDNDPGALTLAIPATAVENAGVITGSLSLMPLLSGNVTVSLASSDPQAAKVPAAINFGAGQTTAIFPITIVEDSKIDGSQTTTITASVAGWSSVMANLAVTDNENTSLTLPYIGSLYEGATIQSTVFISGTLPTDLVISLVSSVPARLSVPTTVTIPAGSMSITFPVSALDNSATDGSQNASIVASAAGFTGTSSSVSVLDNDVHHFGFTAIGAQTSGVPFNVTLTAYDITNSVVWPFTGTVALTAAGDAGAISVTPTITTPFSGGYWSGNVTAAQAGSNVRLSATSGAVSSSSGPFAVLLSPGISATPSSISTTLPQGGTTTQSVTLGNTGGGVLNWNISSSTPFVGEILGGPVFVGSPVLQPKTNSRPSTSADLYTAPRATSAAPASIASVPLVTILNNLNSNHGLVRDAIPQRYPFSEGESGSSIIDGGNDMYDGGNLLGASLVPGSYLPYSNNIIATSPLLGSGGQYFTRKYEGLFVFAADVSGLSYFEITGNLGADGYGSMDSAVLNQVRDGITYRGFVKRVYNAFDPSVNHLIIVADNGAVTHSASTYTDDDQHRVHNLTGVTRIYYLLYARQSGAYIDNTTTQTIMATFLDAIAAPDWVSAAPGVGSIASGSTQNVTFTMTAAQLPSGTYNRSVVISSNDPARPQLSIPVSLVVMPGPAITNQPLSRTVTVGASVTFTVASSDPGPLTYRWRKNGIDLNNGGNISGATSATLTVTASTVSDAGAYSVRVANATGSTLSATATLTVNPVTPAPPPPPPPVVPPPSTPPPSFPPPSSPTGGGGGGGGGIPLTPQAFPYAPKITSQPVSRTAVVGDTVAFTVVVDALPAATYQWFKNGSVIAGATNATLTLSGVQLSAAGNYHVLARNLFDVATSNTVTLQVTEAGPPAPPPPPLTPSVPPSIATQPAAQDVSERGAARFSVSASGTAPLTYQWRKNGVPLPGATSADLTIANVVTDDAGRYAVVVSNSVGAVTSSSAPLTVNPAAMPPSIAVQPVGVTALAGATARLAVVATGTVPFTYEWRRDGAAVAGATGTALNLTNLQAADAGAYTVVVTNSVGTITSNAVSVTLVSAPVAPAISTAPRSQQVTLGSAITLGVVAHGTSPLAYRWNKNGVPISGATAPTLDIVVASLADAGSYSVAVSNSAGSVTSNAASVTIAPSIAPVILLEVNDVAAHLGASAELAVLADGAAPLAYQWRKNGVPLVGANGPVLALGHVQASDAGYYSVLVTNEQGGVSSRAASLVVHGNSYAGSYFGTFGNGGGFALAVDHDNTGVFLGFATGAHVAFVNRALQIDENGHFQLTTTSTGPGVAGIDGMPVAAAGTEFKVEATIGASGTVSGTVSGLDTSLTATRAAENGMTQPLAGYYQAGAMNGSATAHTIVGPSGQAFALLSTPTAVEAGSGSVDATGNLTVTTGANTTMTGSISVSTATLVASFTQTGGATTNVMGGGQHRTEVEKLLNLSTRNAVGGSAGELIAGFVVSGDAPKPVLIRVVGPALGAFGLTNALTAARLELFNGSNAVASNSAWDAASNAEDVIATSARSGAFALPPRSRDAALLLMLEPGAYTVVAGGENNASGIALVEVYDASQNATPAQKVVNIASRGFAGTGENTLTAGFVVSGTVPKRLLLRGVGPALGAFGVGGVVADPQLLVYRGSTVIASNDNWSDRSDAAQIQASAASVGAFAFPAGSKDAALLINLLPGAYTVQVVGAGNTTGVGLVEVYEVQQ